MCGYKIFEAVLEKLFAFRSHTRSVTAVPLCFEVKIESLGC